VLTLSGFLSWRKPFSNKGLLLLVGDYPIRQLVVYEKDFGWMALFGFEPRSFVILLSDALCDLGGKSLWLKASMTG
jgi:hypothetical protein